jgi:hypothetical protein
MRAEELGRVLMLRCLKKVLWAVNAPGFGRGFAAAKHPAKATDRYE